MKTVSKSVSDFRDIFEEVEFNTLRRLSLLCLRPHIRLTFNSYLFNFLLFKYTKLKARL